MKASIVHKSAAAVITGLALLVPTSSAFAYSLNTPVSVSSSTPFAAGLGEVDLSRPSSVEGDMSVSSVSGEGFFLTAGNVAGGEAGYGFAMRDDQLYAVSVNSGIPYFLPLGFVHPGAPIHVKATYTPGDAIRVDTYSQDGSWQEYSRGITLSGNLPSAFFSVNAIMSSLTIKDTEATGVVGSWQYR